MSHCRIDLSAPDLMAKARAETGIDLVDAEVEEPLKHLLQALNTEAKLSGRGAAAMTERILRILRNRLRMQRDIAAHPEILEQKIVRPVILTGAGRTGSTKLHKLLASSGDFLHLPFWRGHSLSLITGDRNEDPAARIREADEYVRWFDAHAPQARSIHPFDTFEPEEETLIFEHGNFGGYMIAFAFVPSFIQWTGQHAMAHYAFLKRGLQYLQWQFHADDERRWLLKTPMHFGMEPVLAQVFPDATFVATHRDPLTTLASQASLPTHYYRAYSDAEWARALGPMMLELQTLGMQAFLGGRKDLPQLPTLDIAYSATTRDALSVAERIYNHAGMSGPSDRARAAMRKWENENAQHKHGVHSYSLESFGLDEDTVKNRFREYREQFGHCF
ncbi:MAG: sulfotransferase [Steroidobacteraceae bacterium]